MPNETIIAKETEKNKRCTLCCPNDDSSASLALTASYSPLNARLDALFLTAKVLELLHSWQTPEARSKVKWGWAWSMLIFFTKSIT